MRAPILPNRLVALAIVALTLAGVASLVGTGENQGTLSTATQALAEKAAQSAGNDQTQPSTQTNTLASSPQSAPDTAAPPIMAGDFTEEESLIDDASGLDPSPYSDDPDQGEVVAIVEEDASAIPVVIEEP